MNNRIKVLRAERNLTQQNLADMVECTRQTINAIEKNKYPPSLALGFRIARVLDTDINDVFEFSDNE